MHIWAERYDRDLDDIFAVQDEVARMIAASLFGHIQQAGFERSLADADRKPDSV